MGMSFFLYQGGVERVVFTGSGSACSFSLDAENYFSSDGQEVDNTALKLDSVGFF